MIIPLNKINPRVVAASLLGTVPGIALATYAAHQQGKSAHEARGEVLKDQVESKKFIKKFLPKMRVATTPEEIEGLGITPEMPIATRLGEALQTADNAFHVTVDGEPAIVAAPKLNKYLLGHEIGHQHDDDKKKTLLEKLFENKEQKAWEMSPVAAEAGAAKLRDPMLKTYRYGNLGRAAIGLTAAGGIAPILLKLLKK